MALPEPHPLSEVQVMAFTSSLGATPVATYVRVPVPRQGSQGRCRAERRGHRHVDCHHRNQRHRHHRRRRVGHGGSAGSHFSATPAALNDVNEDDVISFTPAGATGAATGHCYAVIRRA